VHNHQILFPPSSRSMISHGKRWFVIIKHQPVHEDPLLHVPHPCWQCRDIRLLHSQKGGCGCLTRNCSVRNLQGFQDFCVGVGAGSCCRTRSMRDTLAGILQEFSRLNQFIPIRPRRQNLEGKLLGCSRFLPEMRASLIYAATPSMGPIAGHYARKHWAYEQVPRC